MNGITMKCLSVVALVVGLGSGSTATFAASIDFAFTGTVYTSFGSYSVPGGSIISGTFNLNYDAAIPAQGTGSVGSPGGWVAKANGGDGLNEPVPSALLLSATASVGAMSFALPPISSYVNYSSIGTSTGAFVNFLVANTEISPDSNHQQGATMALAAAADGGPYPWLSNGLPNLAALILSKSGGSFFSYSFNPSFQENAIFYTLDSLTPTSSIPPGGLPVTPVVPLPAALWLLVSGLAGCGVLRRVAPERAPALVGLSRRICQEPEA